MSRLGGRDTSGWVDTFLLNVHGEMIDVLHHRGANRPLLRQHGNSGSSFEWGECGEPLYPQQLESRSSDLEVGWHRRDVKGVARGAATSRMVDVVVVWTRTMSLNEFDRAGFVGKVTINKEASSNDGRKR